MKFCFAFIASLFSCCLLFAQQTPRISIVPKLFKVVESDGVFRLSAATKIYASPSYRDIAVLFAEGANLKQNNIQVLKTGVTVPAQSISIQYLALQNFTDSAAYHLQIKTNAITITAATPTGALYGMQSLVQLVLLQPQFGTVPCADITDFPRFSYRGLMLDVSRHFYPPAFVEKLINTMALYKMNRLHLHLTDATGWRLQIKKYPELTSHAAWRTNNTYKEWAANGQHYANEGDPNAYGGYYTQDQARAMVAFAARRGITIVPEFEMPGHSQEVMMTYPSLSCTGIPYKDGDMCPGNDSTFVFVQDVLKEVMDIFPSKYIHIGGDEAGKESWKTCPKCQQRMKTEGLKNLEELQSYMIKRVEKFLVANNRKLLGWDEIIEGGLAPEATVMSWRGEKGGITAAQQGHDVVMTPGTYCYFDAFQQDPTTQPEAISGFLPIKKVYSYEPIPAELTTDKQSHILGAQANLWTEFIPTQEHAEYMIFPRILALAEVVWSAKANKNFEDFSARMYAQYGLLQKLNINYCRPGSQVDITSNFLVDEKAVWIKLAAERYHPNIRYTTDGSMPKAISNAYTDSFKLTSSAVVNAAIFDDNVMLGKPATLEVDLHKAIGAKVIYNNAYSNSYPAQKDATLVNGYRGSFTYGDGQWQGFTEDIDITLDLTKTEARKQLAVTFMQLRGPGVFMPGYVEVSLSADGKTFSKAQRIDNDIAATVNTLTFKKFSFDLKNEDARYIRVKAPNTQNGFMFTDEIIVY